MKTNPIYIIYGGIFLGLICPWLAVFKPIAPYLLGLMIFFGFATISNINYKQFLQPATLGFGIIHLGVMPFLVFLLGNLMPPVIQLGWFLLSITPPAFGSVIMIQFLKGNISLGISNVILYNLLAPLSMSILLQLYFDTQILNLNLKKICTELILILGIPICLIYFFKKYKPLLWRIFLNYKPKQFSLILWGFFIAIAIATIHQQLFTSDWTKLLYYFSAVLLICIFHFLVGRLSFKNKNIARTAMINLGQKNTLLTLTIATRYFPADINLMIVLYIISHHLVNGFLIKKLR